MTRFASHREPLSCCLLFFALQNGDDAASDSNGGGQMSLPPVECSEKHGYVFVDLQDIVSIWMARPSRRKGERGFN